jgi:hypothetical protein
MKWVPGALSPGVKRVGRDSDYSSPSTAEVKNTWIFCYNLPTGVWCCNDTSIIDEKRNYFYYKAANYDIFESANSRMKSITNANLGNSDNL